MSQIRKALEIAMRERKERGTSGAQTPVLSGSRSRASYAPKGGRELRVDRSRTRVVQMDVETIESNRLIAGMTESVVSDAYRMLRTRVTKRMEAKGWRSLAVTSPTPGSGKTLTAINLATSIALDVTRGALLIDLDLRRPSVHERFGFKPPNGLNDYLQGRARIEDVLFSPAGLERLVILPGRSSVQHSSEMLRSPLMADLVAEAKERYADRWIIIDLPPLLGLDDALVFAPYVDAILMVVENGATRKSELQRSLTMLEDIPLIGTVLNKCATAGSYYYY